MLAVALLKPECFVGLRHGWSKLERIFGSGAERATYWDKVSDFERLSYVGVRAKVFPGWLSNKY